MSQVRNGGDGRLWFLGHFEALLLVLWLELATCKRNRTGILEAFALGFLLFASFCALVGYLSKSGFTLFPFLLVSVFLVSGAIASWRKLKLLEASYPTTSYKAQLPGLSAAESRTQTNRAAVFEQLRNLATPRQARFKPVPRIISIAFPISIAAGVYWAFLLARTGIAIR